MKNRPVYSRIPVDYASMQDLSIDIKMMSCTILFPVIMLIHVVHLNSTELHLQGVAPRSQYSDPVLEAVMLQ